MVNIAFVGNPNVGKSALINAISKSNLKVGNWPGVTVEKKSANMLINNTNVELIDLPGVYSLVGHTIEEGITRDFLFETEYDLIVNVVDVTDLERNLNLTLSLRELQKPMIVVLNFYDELERLDYVVDLSTLQEFLKCPVIAVSAKTKLGISDLKNMLVLSGELESFDMNYSEAINKLVKDLLYVVSKNSKPMNLSDQKIVMLYLEKYSKVYDYYQQLDVDLINNEIIALEDQMQEEIDYIVQQSRYQTIVCKLPKFLKKSEKTRIAFTRKVDNVLLHPIIGLPLFVLLSIFMVNFVFAFSAPYVDFVDQFMNEFIGKYVAISLSSAPEFIQSMVVDGIIGGIGAVLTFVPLMMVLYLFMGFVEESGYMARTAFLLDRVMKRFGLNGKSFVSMVLGFGCTVPAILSTRTLEDPKARKLTALMIPFMSCGARLPVYVLFAGVFFPNNAGVVIVSLYLIGISIALIIGLISKKLNLFSLTEKALIIELPPYRMPDLKVVLKSAMSRVQSYFKKAFTLIFAVLFILWGLSYFPNGDVSDSYIARGAQQVSFAFEPAGFGESWQAVAAIPGSIAAKEVVVGFLGQVLEVSDQVVEEENIDFIADLAEQGTLLVNAIVQSFKGVLTLGLIDTDAEPVNNALQTSVSQLFTGPYKALSAFSFMVFILLSVPCVATLSALKSEFGNRFMMLVITVMLIVPYTVSVLIFQIGKLIVDII